MRGNVLVVDDQLRARRLLVTELRDAGFEVCEAGNGDDGWDEFVRRRPDVVITDMVMPRADGLELLRRIRAQLRDAGHRLHRLRHAADAPPRPSRPAPTTSSARPTSRSRTWSRWSRTRSAARRPPRRVPSWRICFAGKSRALARVRERLTGLAPLETPVLLAGEPGSGRDTAVRILHELGATAGTELVRLEPRAPLLERRPAPPGAVYLDGVDRFPAEAQAAWARHLAASEAEGFRLRPRVLRVQRGAAAGALAAATSSRAASGARLLRFAIELPPLREVPEDLPGDRGGAGRAHRRAASAAGSGSRPPPSASSPSSAGPATSRSSCRCSSAPSRSRADARSAATSSRRCAPTSRRASTASARAAPHASATTLLRALQKTGGNITRTAEELSRSRPAVYRLIEKHGIPLRRSG